MRWACQKFNLFLYGVDFEVCTDHKPVIIVLNAKNTPPSARIERWLLYLQQFRYVVKHIAGVDNHADVSSRLPLDPPQSQDATETAEYAWSVALEAIPAAVTALEVERASAQDPTLQLVREPVASGDWERLSGTTYWSHWHTWMGGLTYVRTIDDVMAKKTKISRWVIDGLPYFLNRPISIY